MESRFFNALLDLLFDVLLWLLGVRDDNAGIGISISAERKQAGSRSIHAGGNRG
jgi:hypothetical protein